MPALVEAQPTAGPPNPRRTEEDHSAISGYTLLSNTTTLVGNGNGARNDSEMNMDVEDQEELQKLTSQLKLEHRIKEGAENLLQMPLADDLRLQVESELGMAIDKINAINDKIEEVSSQAMRKKDSELKNGKRKLTRPPLRHGSQWSEEREDFRSAMQQANSYLKTLTSLTYQTLSSSPTSSPSSSPSTSTIPHPPQMDAGERNRAQVDTMHRLVDVLQRNIRVRYELDIAEVVHAVLPCLADRATKHCRANAYRLIRHALVDMHSVARLGESNLDWYLVKSLSRDNKHAAEREQVIKLIRAIAEIGSERRTPHSVVGSGKVPLSHAVMRAIIAVAEYPEDPFKSICMETLAEILLIDTDLMAKVDGIRVLLHFLVEGPSITTPILASAFLYIVDSPRTRAYLQPGIDLEMALSGVTDAYGKGTEHIDRMRACAGVIASMLRTWSGLMYFCINDKLAIRSIIDGLTIPSLETREVILDMFFDLLNVKPPDWHQAFIDGRRLTMYRKSKHLSDPPAQPAEAAQRPGDTLRLTDQYIALLILVFCKAGLLEALTAMCEESPVGSPLSRKATLLTAELLRKANRVLPLSVAANIQALPQIFNLAADYNLGEHRIIGTSVLSAIDSFNRHHSRLEPAVVKEGTRQRANSIEDAMRRGQRQVEQAKLKLSMQMDDKTFQGLLLDTQVMLTKDYNKWNFDTLQELMEGPLLNPKRMEEAIKVSRYIRKLMSFFHPFSHRFSDMPKTRANTRWVRLGCLLLSALMSSPDGLRFLSEDDFLNQIVKSFAQLDPFNEAPTSDPIFSKKRMQETLTSGYFEMLGTLSNRKEGLELLEKFKLFTAFYHLTELKGRDDLIKGIIENLDYSIDGHSRIVLSKALTSIYKHVRLYSTKHLGALISANPAANAWTLRLLLTQLYDPAIEVREVAVRLLEEACETTEVLQAVVEMQPTLDHLGDVGHGLLLKFMSTPTGFRFLYAAEYIQREMDLWFDERNLHYVVNIEVFLAKAFNFASTDDMDDFMAFDGIVPPHFYGVMAKTEIGCQVLSEKGHFAEFAQFIRRHGLESEDPDLILRLKSILWAVGNIGAAEGGLPFLEEEEIIPQIIEIAEQSLVLSVRGTCFFVLGLISSTAQGAEILDDYHWEATLSPLGQPTGLCVPTDVDRFVSIPSWECASDEDNESRLEPPKPVEEQEVMNAIYNLANTVIANAASRSLAKMKSRPEYREIWSSPSMFYRALHTISSQRYRMPVRRYILDLFNIELDAEVVRDLADCATSLRLIPSAEPVKSPVARIVSFVGRATQHSYRGPESDEDETSDDDERPNNSDKQPVMSLRPMSRIIGFD